MIPLTAYAAGLVAYLLIGVVVWQIADRRNFGGENWRLIYQWPATSLVAALVLGLVFFQIKDAVAE